MLRPEQDAYGREIADCFAGQEVVEVVERDDGYIDTSVLGPAYYFKPLKGWGIHERRAIRFARGRVLDIGCGAGRVPLYLQERGLYVLGVDISPLALQVCKQRGVKHVKLMSITQLTSKVGIFDSVVMFGNNFGLFGGFKRARWLLRRFHGMTSADARLIVASADPYLTKQPEHLAYHKKNRKQGRMSGQVRLRIRRYRCKTPWFDYLMVSRPEMKRILAGTGWEVKQFFDSDEKWGGFPYCALIEKLGKLASAQGTGFLICCGPFK